MKGAFAESATVSERSAAFTADSNSEEEIRFSPRLKARLFFMTEKIDTAGLVKTIGGKLKA